MSQHAAYLQGAEPFFFRGGDTGCLCLHGFTASPAEVRWLGAHLGSAGFTVYGQRLAGHGADPRDLARTTWRDWYASALDGYHLLRAMCGSVVIVGHSMGGLLGLLLATEMETAGVVVLASPILLRSRLMKAARWLKYPLPYTMQADQTELTQQIRAEQARRGEAVLGRVRYDRWSTAAVAQLYALANTVDGQLPQVTAPLLLVYSKADPTAAVFQGDHIARHVGSSYVERHVLDSSGHILPQDSEREQVYSWVTAFVQKVATRADL
jgi:carboxylesterase